MQTQANGRNDGAEGLNGLIRAAKGRNVDDARPLLEEGNEGRHLKG